MKVKPAKSLAAAISATLLSSVLGTSAVAATGEDPFLVNPMSKQPAEGEHEGSCGEGQCGDSDKEGKCGEGRCGDEKKSSAHEGSCGEGSCGGDKDSSSSEGGCGEGSCGGG